LEAPGQHTCRTMWCPRFLSEPYEKPLPGVKNWAGWSMGAGQAGPRRPADDNSPPFGSSFAQTGYAAKSGSFAWCIPGVAVGRWGQAAVSNCWSQMKFANKEIWEGQEMLGKAMSSLKKCFSVIIVVMVFSATGRCEDGSVPDGCATPEEQVSRGLREFREDNDHRSLERAYSLLPSLIASAEAARNKQDRDRALLLMLEFLAECNEAHDKTYDLNDHPPFFTKVMPPLGSARTVIAGMDPKEIKDPEARKQYEEEIAENTRRKEKYQRERILQRVLSGGVRHIRAYVEASLAAGSFTDRHISMVEKHITDTTLKSRILGRKETKRKE